MTSAPAAALPLVDPGYSSIDANSVHLPKNLVPKFISSGSNAQSSNPSSRTSSASSSSSFGATPPPGKEFTELSEDIWFCPSPSTKNGSFSSESSSFDNLESVSSLDTPPPPTLILMFGWMDAILPHLNKYTTVYQKMYPDAAILLVRSRVNFFWRFKWERRRILKKAVEVCRDMGVIEGLRGAGTDGTGEGRLLVHVFSNGGGLQYKNLLEMVNKLPVSSTGSIESRRGEKEALLPRYSSPSLSQFPPRLHVLGTIFDSCPGSSTLPIMVRAFLAPYRNRSIFLLFPLKTLITVWYVIVYIGRFILGRHDSIKRMALALNEPKLLRPEAGRMYIYSEEDDIIPYKYVEHYAWLAETEGGVEDVEMRKWKGTGHVQHARGGKDKYWGDVERFWNMVMRKELQRRKGKGKELVNGVNGIANGKAKENGIN